MYESHLKLFEVTCTRDYVIYLTFSKIITLKNSFSWCDKEKWRRVCYWWITCILYVGVCGRKYCSANYVMACFIIRKCQRQCVQQNISLQMYGYLTKTKYKYCNYFLFYIIIAYYSVITKWRGDIQCAKIKYWGNTHFLFRRLIIILYSIDNN